MQSCTFVFFPVSPPTLRVFNGGWCNGTTGEKFLYACYNWALLDLVGGCICNNVLSANACFLIPDWVIKIKLCDIGYICWFWIWLSIWGQANPWPSAFKESRADHSKLFPHRLCLLWRLTQSWQCISQKNTLCSINEGEVLSVELSSSQVIKSTVQASEGDTLLY